MASKRIDRNYLSKLIILDAAFFDDNDFNLIHLARGKHNQLGIAYLIAYVKTLNRFPGQASFDVHSEILSYAAHQIGITPALINRYSESKRQIIRHETMIKKHLGLKDPDCLDELKQYLYEEAMRSDLFNGEYFFNRNLVKLMR